jgi:LmbE family N-acetylglucosaminyl deacetylase
MQITDAAVFYARLTKWPDLFEDLPEHLISTQLYFKLDLEPWDFVPAMTHFVVDISDTIDQKMESINCYRTQFPPEKARFVERIRSIAEHMGAKANCLAGEMFAATRTVGTRNLMKLVRGH